MTRRVLQALATFEKLTACLLLAALLISVMVQIVSRYVFQSPLPWTDEVSRFLLVWLTFIAAAWVMSDRSHVTVDLAVSKLGIRSIALVDSIATAIVVVGAGVMAWAGIALVRATADVLAPATRLPMPVVYTAGAVGFGLVALHGIATIVANFRDPQSVPGSVENLEDGGL